MPVFYRPNNAYVGDVIPFYDDGLFKPFYLKIWRDYRGPDRVDGWHMLTTADHLRFDEYPTYIRGGTGSVLKIDGTYHMFYCKFDHSLTPTKQMICHATSPDLKEWTEYPEETFLADGIIYEMSDWRDPFVFWNEETHCYWMLVAAQACGKTNRKGCIGLCTSTDLKTWKYEKPFYAPGVHQSAHECPDLFQIGEWYYLIYAAYTDRFQTYYRMSKSLNGPWITPARDTFDTRAFYAAKTGTDGVDRYIYGWNPTRECNSWNFNPQQSKGNDYNTWDWGGNMIVHKLNQNQDGTLSVTVPESVNRAFAVPVLMEMQPLNGEWKLQDGIVEVQSPYAYASALLPTIPTECKLEFDFCFSESPREFGIALQVDENFDLGYYLCFEPNRCRVQYKTGIRMYEDGGKMFPYEVEMERPITLQPQIDYHMKVFVQDTILEAYVNDEIALSTRMFNYSGRRFGLFVSEGIACFKNLRLYKNG